ncbi:tRNA 2-thiouridine(34) synthase MnmA [Candidatus Gracilibacteria bacterium]|nr:tRNA 2-thiouridine(34) synthase MnmA [Candidatus Gracilibacteria bacterium]
MKNNSKYRIAVGLSGGVDSSVAAKLLVDQGYEVIGIFMRNWEDDSPQCTAPRDALDAERVAKKLGIPFHEVNFAKEYWNEVFEYFLEENKRGRTPNPDILCNVYIKFGALLEKAKELGCELLATGHYAKKYWNEETHQWELHIPADRTKDQTYFLHALSQAQLASALFPLEDLEKHDVRRIAQETGFANAEKKDSTGICFIGERNYSEFLQKFIKKSPGNITEADTRKVLGEHMGLSFYTIGQRKELGIGGVKDFPDAPWFVVEKNFQSNELVVSQKEDKLLADSLSAENLTWISGKSPAEKFECGARIRYRSDVVPCTVTLQKDTAQVTFKEPVRAITPGQSIVFYNGDVCVGGGEIQ